MEPIKLHMVLVGCKPKGRHTEQHDIFFSIGTGLREILPGMLEFWPEARSTLHIDAWREVTTVDGFLIHVMMRGDKTDSDKKAGTHDLFFINLGGYKEREFEEFHYKMLIVAESFDEAKARAKKAIFYKHTSVPESSTSRQATAHIDDKYGIDIDDVYPVQDILPAAIREKYEIRILANAELSENTRDAAENAAGVADDAKSDPYHLGYLQLAHI